MNIIDTLEALEAAPQGNARLEVLAAGDSPGLREVLNLALSPDITFGIRQLPEPDECERAGRDLNKHDEESWFRALIILTGELAARKLTGNDAQHEVARFLGWCSDLEQKWSERILHQEPRLNIGAKDVNNTLGAGTIYVFEVPLATDYNKCKPKDLKGTFAVQTKLDGARVVAILPPGGKVRLLSRTGKEWNSFGSIKDILQEFNDTRKVRPNEKPLYLDGEVVSYVAGRIDFQAIQAVMHRKDGVEVGELHYVVFDACFEDDWKSPKDNYKDRLEAAADWVLLIQSTVPNDRIGIVTTYECLTDPAEAHLREMCQKAVEEGYEGLILRRTDCPVERKRGKKLIKLKTFQDTEARITGTVEGNGKLVGMLGALVCTTPDGKAFEIGSGFSDSIRQNLWAKRKELVGQTVNYKYFEMTNDGIPRFPIFRGIRHPDDM